LTHIEYGLRSRAGISGHLIKVNYNKDPEHYVARWIFEVSHYVIVSLTSLSIVFGGIITTFAQLRQELRKIDNDKFKICLSVELLKKV